MMRTNLLTGLALLLSCVCMNLRADGTNGITGAWSNPANGLRGRLIITQEKEEQGEMELDVFLELQNVADVLDSIQISAYIPQSSLQCRVFDGDKNTVAPAPIGRCEVVVPPFALVIPYKSSLRLNVNRHAPGGWFYAKAPPKERTEIVLGGGVWALAEGTNTDYFLEGTFHIEGSKAFPNWNGTLKIPAVRIPMAP